MKIAITGGAGAIGTRLAKAYLNAGHDVFVIDNLARGARQAIDERVRFYQVDIRDGKLRTILQQERPDLVSHHVAHHIYGSPGEQSLADADINVRGLLNVLNSCVDAAVKKLIFASGGPGLYGHPPAEHPPVTEDTPLCPQHAQDINKATGEWYVRYYTRQYALKHTILRYAHVYGTTTAQELGTRKHDSEGTLFQHPLHYFIDLLTQQRRPIIRGTGEEVYDSVFIDDVLQANLCALKHGDNHTLNVSSNRGYTLNQLYQTVALFMDSPLTPVYLSGPLVEPPAIILNNSLAQRILGWSPRVSLAEGIKHLLPQQNAKNAPLLQPTSEFLPPAWHAPTPSIA